jgi:hypothetical protein
MRRLDAPKTTLELEAHFGCPNRGHTAQLQVDSPATARVWPMRVSLLVLSVALGCSTTTEPKQAPRAVDAGVNARQEWLTPLTLAAVRGNATAVEDCHSRCGPNC